MKITDQHRMFAEHYAETSNGVASVQKAFPKQSKASAAVTANRLLKHPIIVQLIDKLISKRNEQILQLKNEYIDETKKKVISELEMDFFLSQIVRGEITFEKTFKITEHIAAHKLNGRWIPGKSIVTFKKINRPPTIMERIRAADKLYKRKNSYAKGWSGIESTDQEDFIILSDGRKCYMPSGEIR